MDVKKFEVKIYYTGFCVYEIVAKDSEDAILKARNSSINQNEFFATIENWKDADTATECKDEES